MNLVLIASAALCALQAKKAMDKKLHGVPLAPGKKDQTGQPVNGESED
jgi:hypothetical protein